MGNGAEKTPLGLEVLVGAIDPLKGALIHSTAGGNSLSHHAQIGIGVGANGAIPFSRNDGIRDRQHDPLR